jgi:hypothetical protein
MGLQLFNSDGNSVKVLDFVIRQFKRWVELYGCINSWRKMSENMLLPYLVLPSSNSVASTISSSFIANRNQNSNLYDDDYCKVSDLNKNHPAVQN